MCIVFLEVRAYNLGIIRKQMVPYCLRGKDTCFESAKKLVKNTTSLTKAPKTEK